MAKVTAEANVSYKELGYIINPITRNGPYDPVGYPQENIIELPMGAQISGAKSQNDWSKFNTPDDVIRIYALVPLTVHNEIPTVTEKRLIYVFPTGGIINVPSDAEKITIVKEGNGSLIYHIYASK